MKVRVNHPQLDNVITNTLINYENLFKEINGIEAEINNLNDVWQGEEAAIFYVKMINYLEKMKSIPETYNTFAKFMKKANVAYKQADENFSNEIIKVENQ